MLALMFALCIECLLFQGYYMLPTVITNVPDTGRCMQEEIFGMRLPVVGLA